MIESSLKIFESWTFMSKSILAMTLDFDFKKTLLVTQLSRRERDKNDETWSEINTKEKKETSLNMMWEKKT